MSADPFSAKSKALTRDLFLVIAVILVGLTVIVLVVYRGIIKERVITEDFAMASAKDIGTYIAALSTVDGGLQIYGLPSEMNVEIKYNSVYLSTGDIKISSEFSGIAKDASFTAKEVCIVKNIASDKVSVCDARDFECCSTKTE